MMNTMLFRLIKHGSNWGYKNASLKNILILTALFLIFNIWLFPHYIHLIDPSGDHSILDTRFGFSPDEAYESLTAFGASGRGAYLFMLAIIDFIYPFIYGMLLILTSSYVLNRGLQTGSMFRILNIAALDAILFDLIENASIIILILLFPGRSDAMAKLASVAGIIKWIAITFSLSVLIGGIMAWIFRKYRPDN